MNIILFFTRGNSLKIWDQVGMFDREVALYRNLQAKGCAISFVTYGGPSELNYSDRIPGITILCNKWRLPSFIYQRLIPNIHKSVLRQANLFKTNQTNGADIALRAAYILNKPLIARCGYMWSYNVSKEHGTMSTQANKARKIEKKVFNFADKVIVTTTIMAEEITMRFPDVSKKITIIPNYVEIERFTPLLSLEKKFDVIFIGRLSPEKNLDALLQAVQKLSVRTAIIGDGNLRSRLMYQYPAGNNNVSFIGNIPNSELPTYLNQSKIFILPSFYEGHPKTLLEAMSCGLPVIGANSPGIREVITHGENGWICETDRESIYDSILHLLGNPELCKKLGENARKYVLNTVSLDRIVETELNVYQALLGDFDEDRS